MIKEGIAGRYWLVDLSSLSKPYPANVGSWIVEAVWAHPLWSQYYFGVIHLRDIPGESPSSITTEGATHEMIVAALSRDHPLEPSDPIAKSVWLKPLNHVV